MSAKAPSSPPPSPSSPPPATQAPPPAPAPPPWPRCRPGRRSAAASPCAASTKGRGASRAGGRFVHASGMPVDLLFFPSVPQVSLYARTLPTSDQGESHTGEHLLLGKGATGQRLQALFAMRLGESSAETHSDLTCYHFRTAAGRAGFFELLDATLTALLHPDFTDEEIPAGGGAPRARGRAGRGPAPRGEGDRLHRDGRHHREGELGAVAAARGAALRARAPARARAGRHARRGSARSRPRRCARSMPPTTTSAPTWRWSRCCRSSGARASSSPGSTACSRGRVPRRPRAPTRRCRPRARRPADRCGSGPSRPRTRSSLRAWCWRGRRSRGSARRSTFASSSCSTWWAAARPRCSTAI